MKKTISVIMAALSFALVAGATQPPPQEFPRMEAFLGYQFTRFNPSSGFVPSFNANGGSGQFAYNFYKWAGLAFDAGAVTKGILNGRDVDTTVVHFVAGPRFAFHNHTRFTPFGQVLFGGAYATTSTRINVLPLVSNLPLDPTIPVTARLTASHTGFAMMAGGGLDIKLSKHIAFRPLAFDYYLTRTPNFITGITDNDINRNNWRYTAGVNFMFGGPR